MDDARSWTVDALKQVATSVDVDFQPTDPHPGDARADLLITVWDIRLALNLKRYSLVDDSRARRLAGTAYLDNAIAPTRALRDNPVLFVVADRVTETAREILSDARIGFLDLRGRLVLQAHGLVINAPVDLGYTRPERSGALSGKAGLEVATALLMQPSRGPAVRELARELERSPSTVSDVLNRMKAEETISAEHRVAGDRLFWQVAERWPSDRTYLAQVPGPGEYSRLTAPLQLGMSEVELSTGWALTDTAAAAAFGAPIAVRIDQPLDFYVPSVTVLRRAQTLLGTARNLTSAACSVRVGPVPAVCEARVDARDNYFEWPTAHPVFIALDLAQDAGRGREILSDWNPPGGWSRVW